MSELKLLSKRKTKLNLHIVRADTLKTVPSKLVGL